MSRDDVQSMFGIPVYATVPSDESEVHQACVQKRLPGGAKPHSKSRCRTGAKNDRDAGAAQSQHSDIPGFFRRDSADLPGTRHRLRIDMPAQVETKRTETNAIETNMIETKMDQDPTVLLIDEDSAAIDSIRRVLGDQASRFKLRRVADVPTALARIWGGGIDLVLLNLPTCANPVDIAGRVENAGSAENSLAPFRELQEKARGVPVVILCDSAGEALARAAVQQGASAYLLREAFEADLLKVLRSVAVKAALSSATPADHGDHRKRRQNHRYSWGLRAE